MIYIYRILINFILLISPIIILIRLVSKKEDPKRFLEKFGFFSKKRKRGKVLWFHTVSVGELLSIISIIDKLEKDKKISQILVTTTTLTSAKLFQKFNFKKTIHQFFPIDNDLITKKFIEYWKPCLAIFVDSEIWPNMLTNLDKQSIKKILLNARVSKRSYRKWKLLGKFSENLFKKFDYTFPQNLESKRYLKKLEVKKIRFLGNLKFSQKKILNDKLDKNLIKLIRTKKVWCAASTHDGEENICLKVHNRLIKKYKNLMLIIIPRHIVRVNSILKDISALNLKPHLHSNKGDTDPKTNVYLVDTYGETELFFNLCKNVFIGKSLTTFGGQNPLEPARHNCSIIHGPNVSNFTEIYEFLDRKKISIKVKNESQLYSKIYKLIGRKNSVNIKDKINFIGLKILNKNLMEIKSLI